MDDDTNENYYLTELGKSATKDAKVLRGLSLKKLIKNLKMINGKQLKPLNL